MDESMVAALGDYENSDLSERHKVAMRLVDAYILGFGHVPDELAESARRHFSDEELLEIGLRVFSASTNKILIALAVDDPDDIVDTRGLLSHEQYYPETFAEHT